jgi:hypothetical protein
MKQSALRLLKVNETDKTDISYALYCTPSVWKRGIFVSAISGSQGGEFYQQGDTSWHLKRR